MIISASRRTDLPAHYSRWLVNRFRDGFVYVRNPMAPCRVSRVILSPETVDGVVVWTKNPIPLMDGWKCLDPYPHYVQFTLTSYGRDMEPGLPEKGKVLIPAFRRLADLLGPERVIWRYDPILITGKYTVDYHLHWFEQIARRLEGYTRRCVFSFVDDYRHLKGISPLNENTMWKLAAHLAEVGRASGMEMQTCCEVIDLADLGIVHGRCIDPKLFAGITGVPFRNEKDKNQREHCGCAPSVDIGAYDSCPNGCRYCYANHSRVRVAENLNKHDPHSPLLLGSLTDEDQVKDRALPSLRGGRQHFER